MKKVCCQIAKNSAHKHGKGDMEEWSGRVVSTWKMDFVKEFVTCILT